MIARCQSSYFVKRNNYKARSSLPKVLFAVKYIGVTVQEGVLWFTMIYEVSLLSFCKEHSQDQGKVF